MFDVMTRIWPRPAPGPREQHEDEVGIEASAADPADAKASRLAQPSKTTPKTLFSVDVGNYS